MSSSLRNVLNPNSNSSLKLQSKHFIELKEGLGYMDEWVEFSSDLENLCELCKSPLSILFNIFKIKCLRDKIKRVQLIEYEKFPAKPDDPFIAELCNVGSESKNIRIGLGIKKILDPAIKNKINALSNSKNKKGISDPIQIDKIGCVVIIAE